MPDAERTRLAIGSVQVPFGTCSEPSNVAAGGGACPLRFRFVGCDHYSTDISYLPELGAYLDGLLRQRERLRSMTEADDWVRAEATPSDEEIARLAAQVRRLEARLSEALGEQVWRSSPVPPMAARRHRSPVPFGATLPLHKHQEVTARQTCCRGHGRHQAVGQRGAVLLGERPGARPVGPRLLVNLLAAGDDKGEVPGLAARMQRGQRRAPTLLDRAQLLPVDLGPGNRKRVDVGGPVERDVGQERGCTANSVLRGVARSLTCLAG
ncbi:hypothetical protein [Streptomyces atratus]|uniref:hypothetical protein n=1 Tax=Streptomyces atratus TaxID=1893 RepID=UPI002259B575|nr:hypothetical protein [Streptomyces atratus]MCX5346007.1 hypothetical protein [Streptomyces atratus]